MQSDETLLPDYRNGSIVNLMASILQAFGARSMYRPLRQLAAGELKKAKNIVLIVVDGMGYEFVKLNGRDTCFYENLLGSITSVFPATTATAITTFNTGLAPQQHAITGWFVYLKELGVAATILPFNPRYGGASFSQAIDPKTIFDKKPVFDQIKAKSFDITWDKIVDSEYTISMSGKARRLGYDNLHGFFENIMSAIHASKEKKYIYAYWPKLDSLCHRYGTQNPKVLAHFKELAGHFSNFLKSISGTGTTAIITADHGLVDTDMKHTITVNAHREFEKMLVLPVCGEPRVAYCYVHPRNSKQFERYVQKHFKDICFLHKSEVLVKKHYFGMGTPDANLLERIGDYVLIMKENYVLRHFVRGESEIYFAGNHGGMSKDEMLVPLIVFKG